LELGKLGQGLWRWWVCGMRGDETGWSRRARQAGRDIELGMADSGRDEWEAQAARGPHVFISRFRCMRSSFKASTDCLVEVPSFRPSHAPWTPPAQAGSSILLNLVRWNPALHRLRLRKFRMGASTGLAAGH
jgi:hypothetical protein